MPLYEYECQRCRARVEARHGVDEPAPMVCPACGGSLERVFTSPGGSPRKRWNPWGTQTPGSPTAGRG